MAVKNDTFWSKICSGFEESGGTPPLRIPRGTNPGDVYQIFNNTHKYKKNYLVFLLPILAFNWPEPQGEREGGCSRCQVMGMINGIFWV